MSATMRKTEAKREGKRVIRNQDEGDMGMMGQDVVVVRRMDGKVVTCVGRDGQRWQCERRADGTWVQVDEAEEGGGRAEAGQREAGTGTEEERAGSRQ
jgi:hypothetical protein